MSESSERKYRIVAIALELLINLGMARPGLITRCISNDDIPEDAKVLTVQWNCDKAHFEVLITHESFEPVPEGDLIPRASGPVWETIGRGYP